MNSLSIIKILLPLITAFFVGLIIFPHIIKMLTSMKMWKKKSVKKSIDGTDATLTAKIHNDENKNVPRSGGLGVILAFLITLLILRVLPIIDTNLFTVGINFLSRNQTWMPIASLLLAGIIGFIDDYAVTHDRGGYIGQGLDLKYRLIGVALIGTLSAYWLFFKNDISILHLPWAGDVQIGYWFLPFAIMTYIFIYSGGVIDGIDGLSGGVFAVMFTAYGVISILHNQMDIAALCFAISGALLAFLWYNIPPAKVFLSESGSTGLTVLLTTIAFYTDSVWLLPVVALPLVLTSMSVIIQLLSKKFRKGKKIFLIAPVHHHFEALGIPKYNVVMKYWIFSFICALTGVVLAAI